MYVPSPPLTPIEEACPFIELRESLSFDRSFSSLNLSQNDFSSSITDKNKNYSLDLSENEYFTTTSNKYENNLFELNEIKHFDTIAKHKANSSNSDAVKSVARCQYNHFESSDSSSDRNGELCESKKPECDQIYPKKGREFSFHGQTFCKGVLRNFRM